MYPLFPYRIVVCWSDEDSAYVAEVPEIPGCMADGPSPEAAIKEAKKTVRLWIEVAKKEKREIPRPIDRRRYSGKFLVRVPPELHRKLDFEAKSQKVSLNRLIAHKLAS
jgi:predicted RNase H-like HicB family nuclease